MPKATGFNKTLGNRMIARARLARIKGEPMPSWRTGPDSDCAIRQVFGVKGYHKSVVCATLNHLVVAGRMKLVEADDNVIGYGSHPLRQYPRVMAVPA